MTGTTSNRNDKMHSYFEKSAAAVTQTFDRLDKNYVQPGLAYATKSYEEQPIRSTFFFIFAVLSFLPVLSFVGFSFFAFGTCTFFALAAALVVSTAAIAFIGFFLALTLAALFCLSIFLTNAAIGTYLVLRYVSLVRADGARAGSVEWAEEVKKRVQGGTFKAKSEVQGQGPSEVEAKPAVESDVEIKEEKLDDGDEHSVAGSDTSTVDDTTMVVGEGSPDRRFTFKDLGGQESLVMVKKEPPIIVFKTVQPPVVEA